MTKIQAPVRHAAPSAVAVPPNVHGPAAAPKSQLSSANRFDGYVKTPPPPSAYARQVAGMSDGQLRQEATKLKAQLLLANLPIGAHGNVNELKTKLNLVEGQLQQRQLSSVTRFAFERSVGTMSDKQLTSARNHEVVERMLAKLRGDAGGVREADAKLAIIDREVSKRENHAITEFLNAFGQLGPSEQLGVLNELLSQVTSGLGHGGDFASVEQPFSQLTSALGHSAEHGAQPVRHDAPAPQAPPKPSAGEVIGNVFRAIFDPIGFFSGLIK